MHLQRHGRRELIGSPRWFNAPDMSRNVTAPVLRTAWMIGTKPATDYRPRRGRRCGAASLLDRLVQVHQPGAATANDNEGGNTPK